jgi:hypothetical protein
VGEIMHSLPLESGALDRRLELGVGGNGIIGRAVTVVDGNKTVVGEGVVGWN